jgi:RNA polymerase sigma factor (sigma-70 family)
MPNTQLARTCDFLRADLLASRSGPSDTELLARVRRDHDEAAFTALVRRYGRTVLAACRSVLRNGADIDDAFQATFLVLFRRIQVVKAETLGNWLFGVAHRIAVRSRCDANRRIEREKQIAERRATSELDFDFSVHETTALLHEEVDRLPESFRQVILACHLRGYSREQAAAVLDLSTGAVSPRSLSYQQN